VKIVRCRVGVDITEREYKQGPPLAAYLCDSRARAKAFKHTRESKRIDSLFKDELWE